MKKQKIELGLGSKYMKLCKKLKKAGIPDKKAEDISFHFMEMEYSFEGFLKNIDNMLISRDKKKILEDLDSIWSDLEYHLLDTHMIPVKKILDKFLHK